VQVLAEMAEMVFETNPQVAGLNEIYQFRVEDERA
jgi:hypothetical protein